MAATTAWEIFQMTAGTDLVVVIKPDPVNIRASVQVKIKPPSFSIGSQLCICHQFQFNFIHGHSANEN